MKRQLLILLSFCLLPLATYAQVYLDEFDDGQEVFNTYGSGYSGEEADGEWTITGDGTTGAFELFSYGIIDVSGVMGTVDMTANNKIFVGAKASNLGTQLRMDVRDHDGYVSTQAAITKTLVNDYVVFEFDFTDGYIDGGYGGTSCAAGPCPVDGKAISNLDFYVAPGIGSFAGIIKIDFISFGQKPDEVIVSDVWQDHFDNDSTINLIGNTTPGFVNTIVDSKWVMTGDGTNGPWDPTSLLPYNKATLEPIFISVAEGDDKIFVRMKSSIDGTAIRLDLQDVNDMATTAGSITRIISTEWETYEFNFSGSYQDLAYGGTGCTVGPCPVDPEQIANLIFFINPGVEGFAGQVEVEYISVGTALEPGNNVDPVLVYGDHFSTTDDFIGTSGAYTLDVTASELSIVGDGSDAPYSSIVYTLHDDETNGGVTLDATGNDRFYIKAKSSIANTLFRIDLIDTAGYTTTLPSFTKILNPEYEIFEINFSGNYIDAGYGGSACDVGTGPCPVDGTAIGSVIMYPNPADGAFDGRIDIDFLSFGAPMEDETKRFVDEFDDEDRSFFADAGGFAVTESGSELVIEGDGSAGMWSAFSFTAHENGEPITVDMTSNNKLYVKAKSTVAGIPLRIDLVDAGGFATTEPSTVRNITEEYSILEFDFSGTYIDGGYGGTSCTNGPCPVDGSVITNFLVYIDPANGGFNGTVTLDWFSTLSPVDDGGTAPEKGLLDYVDHFNDDNIDFISGTDALMVSESSDELSIIGNGTQGLYEPVVYHMHKGDSVAVDVVGNLDKMFIRVKSSVNNMPLRIDIQDYEGYLSSQAGVTNVVTNEYQTLEYNYAGGYIDGGYGGTPCAAGPCPVDGERISYLQLYIDPGVGGYDGTMNIDWISFGNPINTNIIEYDLVDESKIYPNPFNDFIYLELNTKVQGNVSYELYDLQGILLLRNSLGTQNASTHNFGIALNEIPHGMFILNVLVDGQLASSNKITK